MKNYNDYRKELQEFIHVVDELICIGLDHENFMEVLTNHDFKIEFMGVKASIPLGSDSWSSLDCCIKSIIKDLEY